MKQMVVAYRSSARAVARVQDQNSIAAHRRGSDSGRRSYVRRLKLPLAPTSIDCENAALAILDDTVQPAWTRRVSGAERLSAGQRRFAGERGAGCSRPRGERRSARLFAKWMCRSSRLADDRSLYAIRFANDAAALLAFEFESMTLPAPLTTDFHHDHAVVVAVYCAADGGPGHRRDRDLHHGGCRHRPATGRRHRGAPQRRRLGTRAPTAIWPGASPPRHSLCRGCRACRAITCGSMTGRRQRSTRAIRRCCTWTIHYESRHE